MIKKNDLKKGGVIYHRDGEFYKEPPGEKIKLIKEIDKPISFIPGCNEVMDQDLNCDVYIHQTWEVELGEIPLHIRITAKLGKWFGVYKRYFNIVNFEIEEDDNIKFQEDKGTESYA